MANQRAKGQQLIGFWADAAFAALVDKARGTRSRSQFLRESLAEELERNGISVDETLTAAPDRAGKGGPRKKTPHPTDIVRSILASKVANLASSASGAPAGGKPAGEKRARDGASPRE